MAIASDCPRRGQVALKLGKTAQNRQRRTISIAVHRRVWRLTNKEIVQNVVALDRRQRTPTNTAANSVICLAVLLTDANDRVTSVASRAMEVHFDALGNADSIHASSGFHLCIWLHAGQRKGISTDGRLPNTTHCVLRPVATRASVRGHLIKMLPSGSDAAELKEASRTWAPIGLETRFLGSVTLGMSRSSSEDMPPPT